MFFDGVFGKCQIIIIVPLWYALSWVCKSTYWLCTMPFKKHAPLVHQNQTELKSIEDSPFGSREYSDSTFDIETIDEDNEKTTTIHCWKCGCENHFDPVVDKEIMCLECDTVLTIPHELQKED